MEFDNTSNPTKKRDADSRSDVSEVSHDDDVNTRCGYGDCTPDCLQPCAKSGVLLAAMCLFALLEAFIQWGMINICLTTWEKRYQLQSTQSAWVVAAQDMTAAICSPLFGFMATFWHKGRMMTACAVCMVIGNFLFLVPQFASGIYQLGVAEAGGTCDISGNSTYDPCVDEISDTNESYWLAVFIIAQVIYGYTGGVLWTVGITYVDDNCSRENIPLYLGIFNACSALGATLGFIGGGLSLEVYVDVWKIDMTTLEIDSSDPRWVGAWWIGFGVAFLVSIPIVFLLPCFPKEIPAVVEYKKTKTPQAYKGRGLEEMERADFGKSCSDLGQSLRVLFTNPVFILFTVAGIVEMGTVTAFAAFLPKIIQFQFGQTTSMAALIAGAVLVPGSIVGQLLGGVIPKCCGLSFKGVIWMQVTAAYACVFFSFAFLAKCGVAPMAGLNTDYVFNSTMTYTDPFTSDCNDDCNCTTLVFEPICSTDGTSYFSPCHGACATEVTTDDGIRMYGNCSCMPNATSPEFQAQEGICAVDCTEFWIFMPLLLLMIICTFIENTGGYATVMRAVPEKQRAFAFGVQSPMLKLLGTVPIPILFGYIFDQSCEVWQDSCGSQGSCWIYSSDTLALGMFLAAFIVKIISGTCFLVAVLVYKPPPELEKVHEDMIIDGDDKVEKVNGVIVVSHSNGYPVKTETLEYSGHENSAYVGQTVISDDGENFRTQL